MKKKIIVSIVSLCIMNMLLSQDYRFSTNFQVDRPTEDQKLQLKTFEYQKTNDRKDSAEDSILPLFNSGKTESKKRKDSLYNILKSHLELLNNKNEKMQQELDSLRSLNQFLLNVDSKNVVFPDKVIAAGMNLIMVNPKLAYSYELFKGIELKMQLMELISKRKQGQFQKNMDTLESINRSIEEYQDAIWKNEVKLEKRNLLNNSFNILGLHPQRSRAFNYMAYDDTSSNIFNSLTTTSFGIIENTASLQSELISANFGILRVAAGVSVSANTDSSSSEKDASFNSLANKGGNIFLRGENPLIYIHSQDKYFNLILGNYALLTAELPSIGTYSKEWAGSASFGFNIYGDLSSDNDAVKLFANFNPRFVFGTKSYRDNLGTSNTNFIFAQATAGIIIKNKIKIGFTFATLSNESVLTDKGVFTTGGILK